MILYIPLFTAIRVASTEEPPSRYTRAVLKITRTAAFSYRCIGVPKRSILDVELGSD